MASLSLGRQKKGEAGGRAHATSQAVVLVCSRRCSPGGRCVTCSLFRFPTYLKKSMRPFLGREYILFFREIKSKLDCFPTSWAGCQTNIPCSSHKIRTTGSSILLKTLLESANQRAYAQPRVFATEQVPACRNFTAPYRTGFREGETAVFYFFLRRNFQIWVCFAVATWSHWCCLTHNMPPSAPTEQRWLRTSVPRVFEDTSTGKWRLRLLYEYVASVASFVERKFCVFPLRECTRTCLSMSCYVQHTNSYVHT